MAAGQSQASVARKFGVASSTVHRWISGNADARREQTRRSVAKLYATRRAAGLCRCGGTLEGERRQCAECDERGRVKRQQLRDAAMAAYGAECACCGEATPEFLTIDHVNRDGAEHRRTVGTGAIYAWLARHEYPEGFQVLCFNCNCGRERNDGVCPHERERAAVTALRSVG